MKFLKFVGCSLIGLCVTLLVATFVRNGLPFLFLSIVCTAGISLVLWIPLWFTVGFIIVSFIGVIIQVTTNTPKQSRGSDPDQSLLIKYIRQAMAKEKWSNEQIDERLLENGWTTGEIQQARRAMSVQGGYTAAVPPIADKKL